MTVYKYSAFIVCEGRSYNKFEKTMQSLQGLVGAKAFDIAYLFNRKHYEMVPEVLRFIRKAEDNAVTIFNFTNASNAQDIHQYLQNRESQVFFFLHEGDTADPYYLLHLENFFRKNSGVCSVAFVPVMNEGEDLSLASRKNTLDSELVNVKDDESISIPLIASYGVALWAQDAREAGLNLDPSGNDLKTMLDEMLKWLIQPKGIYGLINGVCHSREKVLSRKVMGIAEAKKFLVSCIIPIYNMEKYLCEAIDSVIAQSIGFEENVELILINDGSTDASGAICKEYKKKYPGNIITIEQENAGVSTARNAGLDVVSGEFVAFLDGDDIYEKKYFETGIDFLKNHNDEIDFVAFPLKLFGNVKENETHLLDYKFKVTQIVNIEEKYDFIQVHIASVLIKYEAIGKLRFNMNLKYAEDGELLYRILINKGKYGISNKSYLLYRKRSDGSSAVQISQNSIDYYNKFMVYPRNLISLSLNKYGCVTRYTQYVIMYDLQWYKMFEVDSSIGVNINQLTQELKWIISFIDHDIIRKMKYISFWQKYYLMQLKYGNANLKIQDQDLGLPAYYFNNHYKFENLHPIVYITLIEEDNNCIKIGGYYLLANYEHTTLVAVYNDEVYFSNVTESNLRDVYFLGQNVHNACCFNLDFQYSFDDNNIAFYIFSYGLGMFPVRLYYTFSSRLCNRHGSFIIGDNSIISTTDVIYKLRIAKFSIQYLKIAIDNYIKKSFNTKDYKSEVSILEKYMQIYSTMADKDIWIYMDRYDKADDNAVHLFKYSMLQKDNISKYFVIDNSSLDMNRLAIYDNIVNFGSDKHKLLCLFAKKDIASNFDYSFRYPFGSNDKIDLFKGLVRSKFVFLQHGIIKDNMSSILNRWIKNVKLFITSAVNEYNSILNDKNYGYNEEIVKLTGLSRFDSLINEKQKKIVFIPTWRKEFFEGSAIYQYNSNFKNSSFCIKLNSLLSNTRLITVAKQNGYDILFRPHPVLYLQINDFIIDDYIQIVPNELSYQDLYSEAALMITDYSSAIFDFAYLKKPILYYQFYKNNYEKSYFDYNTMGFGEVVADEEQLIDLIIQNMQNDCVMSDKFKQRVDDFFRFTDKNNCRRIYNEILSMN
jgi:CDP-glycerol glycerophosphotransferase (TagB/SpsB family)/glycosyltransferase involved in cell wall biosynthesis